MIDGIDWPAPGSTYVDDTNRRFLIKEIRPSDPQGRNVVGIVQSLRPATNVGARLHEVDESAYACDLQTFRIVWRLEDPK